jgi:hypothetical protein
MKEIEPKRVNVHTYQTLIDRVNSYNDLGIGVSAEGLIRNFIMMIARIDKEIIRRYEEGEEYEVKVGIKSLPTELASRAQLKGERFRKTVAFSPDEYEKAKVVSNSLGMDFTTYVNRSIALGLVILDEAKKQNIHNWRYGLPVQIGDKSFVFILG